MEAVKLSEEVRFVVFIRWRWLMASTARAQATTLESDRIYRCCIEPTIPRAMPFMFRTLGRYDSAFSSPLAAVYHSIAATASISISQPGRDSRVTTRNVLAGGFATLM